MLMEEVAPIPELVPVELYREPQEYHRLSTTSSKLLWTKSLTIESLHCTESGARWTPNQQKWTLSSDLFSSPLSVRLAAEVPGYPVSVTP